MKRVIPFVVAISFLYPVVGVACAERWVCGDTTISCDGSAQTCARLKQACGSDRTASSDVERELSQALSNASSRSTTTATAGSIEKLSQGANPGNCSDQEIVEGRCGILANAQRTASYVVETIQASVAALNEATRILGGAP